MFANIPLRTSNVNRFDGKELDMIACSNFLLSKGGAFAYGDCRGVFLL